MKKGIIALLICSVLTVPVFATDYTSPETIKQVQEALNAAGYNCGAPDGIAGSGTKGQIEKYRADKGLAAGTEIDTELCQSLGLEGEPETHLDFEDESDGSLLKGMTITAAEVREIYEEYEEAWKTCPDDPDLEEEYEEETTRKIAEKHGITPKQADNVYFYVIYYGLPGIPKSFELEHGNLLDVKSNGTTLVLKAKITASYSDKATIDQNYFNVCDVIKNQGGNEYDKISYWAVSDMSNGEESKVISFDISKDLIDKIASGGIAENQIGEYVDNLWVFPGLRDAADIPKEEASLDGYAKALENLLSESFSCSTSVDDDTVLCSVWADGVSTGVTYALMGDKQNLEAYSSMKASLQSGAQHFYEDLQEYSPGSHLLYSLLNDLNTDNVFLMFYDGVCVYDVLTK